MDTQHHHVTTTTSCPGCKATLDRATAADGRNEKAPEAGDLTICAHCGWPLRWNEDMELRVVTEADVQAMPTEVLMQLWAARMAWVRFKQRRAGDN